MQDDQESVLPAQEQVSESVVTETESQVESPETQDEAEGEQETTEEQESGEDPKPRKKHWAHERINEVTLQKREVERKLAAAEAKLAEREEARQANDTKPKLEDFDYNVEAHAEAMVDWKLEQREKKQQKEQSRAANEDAEAVYQTGLQSTVAAAKDKYQDLDLTDKFIGNSTMSLVIESDAPEDVFYHLVKNQELAMKLANMSLPKQALELAKLEKSLAPTAPRTTKATAPIAPVKTQARTSNGFRPDMSQAEYEAWRYPNRK
jgi:hypothetical protein